MMGNKPENPAEQVGVIIGRFEVAELTEGHRQLFDYVINRGFGTNVLILGLSPLKCTTMNPLDFEARRLMIEAEYPGKFNILYIKDQNDDKVWSEQLDQILDDVRGSRDVKLIGSRDCFFDHYFGKFKDGFEEYVQKVFISGTEQRKSLSRQIKNSPEWRAGVVYACMNRYPTVYSTVDCAIFSDSTLDKLYLARKPNERQYRFVGGFADPRDNSFEQTAKREASEETGLECEVLAYAGSQKIDDWRYRSEQDKIMTHLFVMTKTFGRAKANDDVCELRLFDFDELTEDQIMPEHKPLFAKLKTWREAWLKTHPSFAKIVGDQLD